MRTPSEGFIEYIWEGEKREGVRDMQSRRRVRERTERKRDDEIMRGM